VGSFRRAAAILDRRSFCQVAAVIPALADVAGVGGAAVEPLADPTVVIAPTCGIRQSFAVVSHRAVMDADVGGDPVVAPVGPQV